jgi:hypothetical protein
MKEVYFETENAIVRFSHDDAVERLPYYESALGTAEATALRNLLTQPEQIIKVPKGAVSIRLPRPRSDRKG